MTQEEIEIEKTKYTRKIKTPIYEPKNIMPNITEVYDTSKRDELIQKIITTPNLPTEIEIFLRSAAERHTKFNYSKIADFYAHSSPEIKRLFEDSALVIIDYNSAIENGFTTFQNEVNKEIKKYVDSLPTEKIIQNKKDSEDIKPKTQEPEIEEKELW